MDITPLYGTAWALFPPIVAIILSALLLKEDMGIYGMIGAVLVLGSTFISEMPEKERN